MQSSAYAHQGKKRKGTGMVKRQRPAKESAFQPGRGSLSGPWISVFVMCQGIRVEPDGTATIWGIGNAAAVPQGEIGQLSFLIVASGGTPGQTIRPTLEIESPFGEKQRLSFDGKLVSKPNQIVDWTIKVDMVPAGEGTYRARAFLNDKLRSELPFQLSVR